MASQSQALQKNQILQASHHLLSMLDRSKKSIESVIDTMPNLYGVIRRDGTIIKANRILSGLFPGDQDQEMLLRQPIQAIFPETTWKVIQARLAKIKKLGDSETFEVSVALPESDQMAIFNLHIRFLENEQRAPVYEIFGVDVTAIRAFERQLSQIFKSIPLGIFRVDANLEILNPYSSFSEVILGTDQLVGRNAMEVLFEEREVQWTKELREQVGNLRGVVGFSPFQFDVLRDHLPKMVKVKLSESRAANLGSEYQWIGFNFDPMIENDTIVGLLIVLEDRTSIELEKENRVRDEKEESIMAARLMQAKRIPSDLRNTIYDDLHHYQQSIEADGMSDIDLKGIVHAIKGIARSSGLQILTEIAHGFEDDMRSMQGTAPTQIDSYKKLIKELEETIDTLGFCARRDPNKKTTAMNSQALKSFCEACFQSALEYSNAKLKFIYQSDRFEIDGQARISLKEACTHILSNAVAHGFSDDAKTGKVNLKISVQDKLLTAQFSDNGNGINAERLLEKAISNNYLTAENAKKLSHSEILEFVFADELSTKEEADELGGRGVGLSAIKKTILSIGGTIEVSSTLGKGTEFILTLPIT